MLSILQPKRENSIAVLTALIKKLNIPVSAFTINDDLHQHPDYPSLLALTDCLTSWNIPNEAVKINKENCITEDLPTPFIAHLNLREGRFILVNEILHGVVKFNDGQKTEGTFEVTEFLKDWDGIILYAEKDLESGESNYKEALIKGRFNKSRLPFLMLIVLIAILNTINYSGANWAYITLLGVKLSGIIICTLLLIYSINSNSSFIQDVCSLGKKNDCNAILKSEAAQLTSWLSWSEIGMFYFFGSFICLVLNISDIECLSWLNLLCLPYTFYSIAYQIRIKRWCLLCSSVQALFWFEAIVFFIGGNSFQTDAFNIKPSTLFSLLLCFLLPAAIWKFIKPVLLKAIEVEPLKYQLKKFKYNKTLFNQLLYAQDQHTVPDDLMPIIYGNPKAETVITMISNPFCSPCAFAHKVLDQLVALNDEIQLKIIFNTPNNHDDKRAKVARHISALSLLNDKNIAKRALNDWYLQANKSYEIWKKRYPTILSVEMNTITEKQSTWCNTAKVTSTPTILINGYKLMEPYKLEDIKYLLN
ncbi:hypothetical protein FBD94_22875 [Pedobacter hiemivivus]|uniref:Peptidase C39 domain-containing protein n=1 Tax=Pedobacter hiemivivus TaxID=2530454 RepID=A0A4U1FZL5_9SPHI|nr:thioredoxin domain-containing protein [Pedobacter hiemivivus]TKC56561.1 hypothetical protein FBD94_22875 [Pedobacter hiemivivus]